MLALRRSKFLTAILWATVSAPTFGSELEVHYINVGQGMSVLIVGPDGTSILYDFGNYVASKRLIPYLKTLGYDPEEGIDGFDYSILSHFDHDHFRGYHGLVHAGYDIRIANFGPRAAPEEANTLQNGWVEPARATSAGTPKIIGSNRYFQLGSGAEARVIAANGRLFTGEQFDVRNKNDESVSLLLSYGQFQMIIDGDIGGGKEECTGLGTDQIAMQSHIVDALIDKELINPEYGVEVINVAHHGSHSSTSAAYFSKVKPQAAFISVGNPNKRYQHPRRAVMEKVLLQQGNGCGEELKVPPAKIFQTDFGSEVCNSSDPMACAANFGIRCGDVKLTTDGKTNFQVSCNGRVWSDGEQVNLGESPEEIFLEETFLFDESQTANDAVLNQ